MLSIWRYIFEQEEKRVEKVVITKNYVVEDFENPPQEYIEKYRRKEIIDREGHRHLATFAILNKEGQEAEGVKTIMTSMWHPKTEDKKTLRSIIDKAPIIKIKTKKISSEEEM